VRIKEGRTNLTLATRIPRSGSRLQRLRKTPHKRSKRNVNKMKNKNERQKEKRKVKQHKMHRNL
jgi:hypothetical protein